MGYSHQVLIFVGNQIGEKGAKEIAEVLKRDTLVSLDISSNEIGDNGAEYIVQALKGRYNLRKLYLSRMNSFVLCIYTTDNNIGDRGAVALASLDTFFARKVAKNYCNEEFSLVVAENEFGNKGVDAIVNAMTTNGITEVLENQQIFFFEEQFVSIGDGTAVFNEFTHTSPLGHQYTFLCNTLQT
jgi:hypothetical protein